MGDQLPQPLFVSALNTKRIDTGVSAVLQPRVVRSPQLGGPLGLACQGFSVGVDHRQVHHGHLRRSADQAFCGHCGRGAVKTGRHGRLGLRRRHRPHGWCRDRSSGGRRWGQLGLHHGCGLCRHRLRRRCHRRCSRRSEIDVGSQCCAGHTGHPRTGLQCGSLGLHANLRVESFEHRQCRGQRRHQRPQEPQFCPCPHCPRT
jgi:hypothetical protein